MIDSHCHLDGEKFDGDREATIARAVEAGVGTMLAIGTGELDVAIRMAERYPQFLATVGVHPHDAAKATEGSYERLVELARHPKVVAVGEMGLDYHYDFAPRDIQREVFIRHLKIAREAKLPIVIHTREAWADTLEILREHWDASLGGVFHCFTGSSEEAREAVGLNFHVGLGGVLTYPKAEALREAARETPLERILLETDSPYLAPVPHRGKRNEPAFVMETAKKLAEIKGMSLEEVDEATSGNFRRLFRLKLEQSQ